MHLTFRFKEENHYFLCGRTAFVSAIGLFIFFPEGEPKNLSKFIPYHVNGQEYKIGPICVYVWARPSVSQHSQS